MFNFLCKLLTVLPCALFATIAAAADHSIHIEWGYTPPSDPSLAGYNLYQEGTLVCTTSNPDATAMDCDVSLEKDSTNFTLTALFSDNSESPHSAPFPFSIPTDQTNDSSTADMTSSVNNPYVSEQGAKSSSTNIGSHSFTFHWESTSSPQSYRVYLNNTLLCQTQDPNASTITCNADLINGLMAFSMTEVSTLGIECAPSNLLLFDPTVYPTLFNPKKVQLSWEYPAAKGLAGFRVYQNNTLLCETNNPATRQLTCIANITSPVVAFNITAVDNNTNETPLSNTLTYSRESQPTNTAPSTLAHTSLLLADPSNATSNDLTETSSNSTASTVASAPLQTTILIQPLVYTTALVNTQSENTVLAQPTDTYTAVAEPTTQTSTTTATEELPSFNLEVGEIYVTTQWKRVVLTTPFQHPIVIAKSPVTNDSLPGVVHLQNITSTGFDIAYTQQNDSSLENTPVHYMVMEQGRFLLNQTTLVEAGSFSASSIEEIHYTEPFATTPVVLTTLATTNQTATPQSQLLDINPESFQHSLQAQATNTTVSNETIHYIAWEQGNGILDTILYNASISASPLTENANAFTQQTSSFQPTFFFPCRLSSIDQTTDTLPLPTTTITAGYLAIVPSENEGSN